MAKIPRQVSRRVTPSGRVGDVPVSFDIADTGAEIEARGLGALGQGVGNLGQALGEIKLREQTADDLLASDNISLAVQGAKDKFAQFKEDSPDPKTWAGGSATIWDEAFTAANSQQFHNKDVGERALFQFGAEQQHGNNIAAIQAADATTKIAVKATRDTLIKAFARGDDTKDELLAHQIALKNELGDDDLVKIAMADAIAAAETQRIAVLTGQGKYSEARKLVSKTLGLNPTEKESQLNIIDREERAALNNRKKRSELELDTSAAQVEPNWLKNLEGGTLTRGEILAWNPDVTDPDVIREVVDIKEEWIKKLSRPVGSSSGYAKLIEKIDLNPQDFKASDIYAMVKPGPDGISETEAPSLVDRLKRNQNPANSFNSALHSRYQAILKAQFVNDIIDVGNKKDNTNRQNEMSLAITEFANNNPEATTKDWNEFYNSLTREDSKNFGFLKAISIVSPAISLFRLIQTRRDEDLINLNPTPETSKQKTKLRVGDTIERNGVTFVITRFVDGRPKVIEVE